MTFTETSFGAGMNKTPFIIMESYTEEDKVT